MRSASVKFNKRINRGIDLLSECRVCTAATLKATSLLRHCYSFYAVIFVCECVCRAGYRYVYEILALESNRVRNYEHRYEIHNILTMWMSALIKERQFLQQLMKNCCSSKYV